MTGQADNNSPSNQSLISLAIDSIGAVGSAWTRQLTGAKLAYLPASQVDSTVGSLASSIKEKTNRILQKRRQGKNDGNSGGSGGDGTSR